MRARLNVSSAERHVCTSEENSDGRDLSKMIAMKVSEIFSSGLFAVLPSRLLCNAQNCETCEEMSPDD